MPSIEVVIPSGLKPEQFRNRVCKAAIKGTFGTIGAFALSIGASRVAVSAVLNGHWRSARIESALATLTGYSHDVLFPSKEKAA